MLVGSLGWENPLEKEVAFQHFCLESPLDKGGWQATDQQVTNSHTQLSNKTALLHCTSWVYQHAYQWSMDGQSQAHDVIFPHYMLSSWR